MDGPIPKHAGRLVRRSTCGNGIAEGEDAPQPAVVGIDPFEAWDMPTHVSYPGRQHREHGRGPIIFPAFTDRTFEGRVGIKLASIVPFDHLHEVRSA